MLAPEPQVSILQEMARFFWHSFTFFVFTLLGSSAMASEKAKRLKTGVSLIQEWTQDQHLYVAGDLNLSREELNKLEKWLDENGKNWTILLTQSSHNERYKGPFGDNLKGVNAVENALTRGLPSRTNFGELRNSKTGLLNGALFIIYLQERQFSYFGSAHYSQNNAGPERFKNDLDSQARKSMRNGGRIIDAVKKTVATIDARAGGAIAARERRRVSSTKTAQKELHSLRSKLSEVSEKHATIIAGISQGGGDFSRFPASKFKDQLKAMEKQPGIFDAGRIKRDLNQWDELLVNYKKDQNQFSALEKTLTQTKPSSPKGKSNQTAAKAQLKQAKEAYQQGRFSYQRHFENAKNSTAMIDHEDRAAKLAAKRRSDTLKVGGLTTAGGLCLIGAIGNRRRRRIKSEAEELLASRKLEIKETEDRLFELMDRAAVIVGPFDELESRGYTGETLSLSKKALRNIDEAFVLSSNVQRIIEEGEELIGPSNPLSRSRNLVSGGRYERAVDLLDAELNLGLQNVPDLKTRTRPGEEIDETFSVPIDEWGSRTTTALDAASDCLDRVEKAWSTIIERRERLRENIDTLVARQNEIQIDEWLRCELLFDEWIPAMDEAETRASEIGKSDPVNALDDDMAEGDRMAGEAKRQLDLVSQFRTEQWQRLENAEAILNLRKRDTMWIELKLAAYSETADNIASNSPDGSVSDSINQLESALRAFALKTNHAAELIVRADDSVLPKIEKTTQFVSTTRNEIATALNLHPDDILREEGHDPSRFLSKARQQHEASLSALDLGEVDSTESSLDEADALCSHVSELTTRSKEVLTHYQETSEALWQRRTTLEQRGQQLNIEIEEMRKRYAPRALFLETQSPELGTLADGPIQLENSLNAISSRLDRAKTRFKAGGLLESWDLLLAGQSFAKEGEVLCLDVSNRRKELTKMESENTKKYERQNRACADQNEPVRDRRVTQETIKLHYLISTELNDAAREIEAEDGRRDPYLVEEILEAVTERLPVLRESIEGDLKQNQRALQLFDTVKRNQKEALTLWDTAENDQIPNSQKTNQSMNEIEACHGKLEDVHRHLKVDHADWREIQNDLRAIHLSISEAVITLKKELQLARETVRALEGATREIRRAARWSGSYGVRITGSYGGQSLATANDVMQHGRYPEALQLAGQARARARAAIAQAEAREAAKRRAAAAARRRRNHASSRPSFGRSSIGSSSRSRSSFSSSRISRPSSSRSSFRSGSGAGRSGW